MSALTPKQARFVAEYLVDLNGKQAAIRAGYSVRRAEVTASELLADRKVSEAVAAAQQDRATRTGITQDRVLQELARLAFSDIRKLYRDDGSLKPVNELDDDTAAALQAVDVVETAGNAKVGGEEGVAHQAEYVKKVRLVDKNGPLGLAMRHLGMLKDKVEHTGKDGAPIETTATIDATKLTLDQLRALASIPVRTG